MFEKSTVPPTQLPTWTWCQCYMAFFFATDEENELARGFIHGKSF
jgi:hypothetical protein